MRMERMWVLAMAAMLVFTANGSLLAQSEDITVTSEGVGASPKDALLSAKREAVEVGIGTVLISQTEIKNFQLQKDVVLTRTVGAVKSYTVLEEAKNPDNTNYVKIQATVSLADIKDDLAALRILLESMDKPRMMVVITESNGRGAETAVVDYLSGKGFIMVDPAVAAALLRKDPDLIRRAADGDPAAAAAIGAANGAEYILVGKVNKSVGTSDVLKNSGMVSGQAVITAKVVNCSGGQIIAAKSTRSAAAHISQDAAMDIAAGKAGTKLMDQALFETIVASFQDSINNGLPLTVLVRNVNSYSLQKAVRECIGRLPKAVSVTKRRYGNDELSLAVIYKGNADAFSDAVDGKSLQGRTLSVTAVEGSRVVLGLK
jgi:hypothetical protein